MQEEMPFHIVSTVKAGRDLAVVLTYSLAAGGLSSGDGGGGLQTTTGTRR